MTDEPPKKKSLAGLGQMLEKAAAEEKAAAAVAEPVRTLTGSQGTRDYHITFRKKLST